MCVVCMCVFLLPMLLFNIIDPFLMWDVLLYMCCFYSLMNKAISANGLVEWSQAGNLNRDIESRQSKRDAM